MCTFSIPRSILMLLFHMKLQFGCVWVLPVYSISDVHVADFGLFSYTVNTTCPPGTAYVQHNCTCVSNRARIVSCRQHDGEFEVGVLIGYCMTMNSKGSEVVVGSCPFNIIIHPQFGSYTPVPNNLSQLDRAVCNYTHRAGQLCGQCANGTSPPIYSYYPQCVDLWGAVCTKT